MNLAQTLQDKINLDITKNTTRMSERLRSKLARTQAEAKIDPAMKAMAQNDSKVAKDVAEMIETNANEVMATSNTGYGAENVPTEVWTDIALDLVPTYSRLLPMLPGDHGNGLPLKETSTAIGDSPLSQGRTEWIDQASSPVGPDAPNYLMQTAKCSIEQGSFQTRVALSDRELAYSAIDIESLVRNRLAASVGRTVDAFILNADSTSTATGNVNSDDGAPAATSYFLQGNNGIRKLGLSDAAHKADVGALTWADFLTVMSKLGNYASNPSDLLWVFNTQTFLKSLGLDEFKQAYQNGLASTIYKGAGAISNILGADIMTHKDFGLTEADGKISTTAASNTVGGFACIHKPSIQYGFGKINDMEVARIAGKGVEMIVSYDFGFTIADQLAGNTSPAVALAYNATV